MTKYNSYVGEVNQFDQNLRVPFRGKKWCQSLFALKIDFTCQNESKFIEPIAMIK